MDKVDKIIKQWNQERPDIDADSMRLIGRFKKVDQFFKLAMAKTFAEHNLNAANFDVLATLRRSGSPYALSPNALVTSTMVTSGTMTNRIDQLIKSGLVERVKNPNDGRSVDVSLTKVGFELIDSVLPDHIKTQDKLVSCLSQNEKKMFNEVLRKLLIDFESE